MADTWTGTRAGQHASVVLVVKEDDGMPWVDFQPGDLPSRHIARCLHAIVSKMVVLESVRLAEEEATTSVDVD